MSDNGVYAKLAERFAAEDLKTRKQGGQDLIYATGEMVISRLNDALGVNGWSFSIVREGVTDVEAWVLVELTATIDGVTVTRQHYGNQDLTRGSRTTSDLFKSAATDALKKAATTIGVGLYLYDEDERREARAEMLEAGKPKRPAAPPKAVQDAAYLTGAQPTPIAQLTVKERWARLVKEAEAVNLPTLGQVKAIDPDAISEAQLAKYADRLDERLEKRGAT